MKLLEELIEAHFDEKFPKLQNGSDYQGICLIYLDTKTAGCISYFKAKKTLDPWRLSTIGLCYGDLITVCKILEGKQKKYFLRLRDISKLILENIEKTEEKR